MSVATMAPARTRKSSTSVRRNTAGLAVMAASELASGLLGFSATVQLARRLGPSPFARFEFAAAVSAWLLVLVRGGIEQVVWREASRRPDQIGSLTDVLLGLKATLALVGFGVALLIAARLGGDAGLAVAISALILPATALSVDVAPRALGCFGPVALGQAVRAAGFAVATLLLVSDSTSLIAAAWCAVGSELLGGFVPTIWQVRRFGWPRPRFRRRTWFVLARRGGIASLTRFGRVTLYGADILVLGWFSSADLGSYSASRRLIFAAVSLGLIVPTVFAPAIASAFAVGRKKASRVIADAQLLVWAAGLPAAITLGLAGDRWLRLIFGVTYRSSSISMALIAARLPWIVSTTLGQSALVACRRERSALGVIALMVAASVISLPIAESTRGATGVGAALLAIEALGAVGMSLALGKSGIRSFDRRSIVAACFGGVTTIVALGLAAPMSDRPFLVATLVSGVFAVAGSLTIGKVAR